VGIWGNKVESRLAPSFSTFGGVKGGFFKEKLLPKKRI
jgi:hypothetical protein